MADGKSVTNLYEVKLSCNNCRGTFIRSFDKGNPVHQNGTCPICRVYNKEFKVEEHNNIHGKKEILLESS